MEKCAFDERMESSLRLEKWDLMCNLLDERTRRLNGTRKKKGKANKRQWDQMEFIFLVLKQGVALNHEKNLHLPKDWKAFPPPHYIANIAFNMQ